MDRRELLALIAAATGAAFVEGCARSGPPPATFGADDIAFFDEVAETIMPRTDTPGAKDAHVGAYIATYAEACYELGDLAVLKAGIGALNAEMERRFAVDFMRATPAQRTSALIEIDREAHQHARATADMEGSTPHYFTLMKQLTLNGFFTSELGATKVARYRPVPGKYKGVIDYKPGETFWAWA
ncbi:MAG: gluconate 2-dehydrogenase subunit 3 family protein [Pseudomonadota bacterium]